jgi:transcriptional regulator with XRE-family HTH domain
VRTLDPLVFGSLLREIREESGMTQSELSEKTGISSMHISHFECGRRLPDLHNFAALMRGLGDYSEALLDL